MSIDRRVDKEEAVHVHSGTLLRQEKDPNHAFVATWMHSAAFVSQPCGSSTAWAPPSSLWMAAPSPALCSSSAILTLGSPKGYHRLGSLLGLQVAALPTWDAFQHHFS